MLNGLENTLGVGAPVKPKQDDQKIEAQKMATDLSALAECWTNLKNDPSLADDSMFWSQIATAVDQIQNEYSYLLNVGVIPQADLSQMFGSFDTNVLLLKAMPSSQNTLLSICAEAEQGQTADLHQFLDTLVSQPGVLKTILGDTQTAENAFQKYADSH